MLEKKNDWKTTGKGTEGVPNSVPLVAELPSLNFSEIFNFPWKSVFIHPCFRKRPAKAWQYGFKTAYKGQSRAEPMQWNIGKLARENLPGDKRTDWGVPLFNGDWPTRRISFHLRAILEKRTPQKGVIFCFFCFRVISSMLNTKLINSKPNLDSDPSTDHDSKLIQW